jgi:hypothetical protein
MKKYIYFFIVPIMLISCSNQPNKLEISQFGIENETGEQGILVSETGDIKIMNEAIGKITVAGKVFDKKNKVIASLDSKDNLLDAKGNILCKIDKDGNIDNGSGTLINWTKNGEWYIGNEKANFKIRPNNPNLYRAASIVLFLYLEVSKK